jgi:hypothetical protein
VSDLGETISNVSCHAEGENSVGREEAKAGHGRREELWRVGSQADRVRKTEGRGGSGKF